MSTKKSMVGPQLWLSFLPARDDPGLIDGLVRSAETGLLSGLGEAERTQRLANALTTLLVEPVYWRGFADAVERVAPSNRRVLLGGTTPFAEGFITETLDTRLDFGELRDDQQRFLLNANNAFDASVKELYRGPGAAPLEDARHPYHPIWRALVNVDASRSLELRLAPMARQQFINVMFMMERIIAPWAAMSSADISAHEKAREIEGVHDIALAVVHNFPRLLQTMRVSPIFLDGMMMGVLNGSPERGGIRHLIGRELGGDALAPYERAWRERRHLDFADDLSYVQSWDDFSRRSLPTVGLSLYPKESQRIAGEEPAGIAMGPKGRCPAPERVTLPQGLRAVAQGGDRDWAARALNSLRGLQASKRVPGRGSPRSDGATSIAELVLHMAVRHLGDLVEGRTTGTGRVLANQRSWPQFATIQPARSGLDFPRGPMRRPRGTPATRTTHTRTGETGRRPSRGGPVAPRRG
jgi:hypothetical protein